MKQTSDAVLGQSDVDAMLAMASEGGVDAIGPRPARNSARFSGPSPAASLPTPMPPATVDPLDLFTAASPSDHRRELELVGDDSEANTPPTPPRTATYIDRDVHDVHDRVESLERMLASLTGDTAAARDAAAQLRALQEQVRTLTVHVRGLQRRIDDMDRRLATITRRPPRRARRTLWSTSVYVDAAAGPGASRWR